MAGETLVDIVVGDGEHSGGSAANVAVALGRLGADVTLATWIANDTRGRRLAEHLAGSGVAIAEGSTRAARTPTATAELAPDGSARYRFDLSWDLPVVTGRFDALHHGSLGAVLEPGASKLGDLVERARPDTTISFDPNVRPALVGPEARPRLLDAARAADLVRASDEDLAWLCPGRAVDEVAADWLAAGVAVVVVTRGPRGVDAWCRAGRLHVRAAAATVVDTIGAGDTFTGALLWCLDRAGALGGARRDRLRDVPAAELERHLTVAARAAAVTVSRRGADPPRRSEIGDTVA